VADLKSEIWTFQRSDVLKSCKETEITLHRMLICKIARHIIILGTTFNCNLICTFPSGNGYIDVVLTWKGGGFAKVRRFKFDPEAPTKASLTIDPENETQVF
jgi:hypothetical protein